MPNPSYLSPPQYNQIVAARGEKAFQTSAAELSSGGTSSGYADVKNIQQFLGQELVLEAIESYKDGVTLNSERMGFVSTQLATMRQMAIDLQGRVSLLRSSPLASPHELSIWCNDKLNQVTSILNGRFDGKYLMSGTASNVPAVTDLASLPAMGLGDAVDSSLYYLGNTQTITFRANDQTLIDTPVRADNLGIAELISALRLCAALPANELDDRLSRANGLSLQAHADLVEINTELDENIKDLEAIGDQLMQLEQTVTENIQKLGYKAESDILQQYVQNKQQLELTRFVTTSLLNSVQDLIRQIPT